MNNMYDINIDYERDFFHYFVNGGYGDTIMALPVFLWGQKHDFKDRFIITIARACEFFYKEVLGDRVYPANQRIIWGKHGKLTSNYVGPFAKTNLSKYYSMTIFGRTIPGKELSLPKLSPRKPTKKLLRSMKVDNETDFYKKLENAVVIPTSFRTRAKAWDKDTLSRFMNYLLEKKYSIVLVGGKNEIELEKIDPGCSKSYSSRDLKIFHPKVIDLVGQLSFEETFTIMQHSRFFVGITGGLVQLAALSDIPILCITTYTDIYMALYWRDGEFGGNTWAIEPEESSCRFCINEMYVQGIEYNFCLRKKDYECSRLIRLDKIINKFETMEKGQPCELIEKFKKEELPNLDI